ncbi:unnamed protein product [Ixodes pacificus]
MGLTISLIDFSVSCKGEPGAPLASYITLQNLLLLSHAFYAPCLQIKKGSINITVMHRIAFRRQYYMSVKVAQWLCDELRKALELTLWSLWTAMT